MAVLKLRPEEARLLASVQAGHIRGVRLVPKSGSAPAHVQVRVDDDLLEELEGVSSDHGEAVRKLFEKGAQ